MKKFVCIFMGLLLITIFTGCGKQTTNLPDERIETFSWNEEKEYYTNDTPGVKTSNFNNTVETSIENKANAISCAKSEVTIDYNAVDVSFDENKKIWKVCFYTKNVLGGDQTVYLNSNGITQLIVYGE